MNKKLISVLLSLLVVMVIAGCTGTSSGGRTAKTPSTDFRSGTQGIEMKFLRLPSRVYAEDDVTDDQEFQVDIELTNKGAFPQPEASEALDGDLYLSGYDDTLIMIDRHEAHKDMDSEALEGKNIYNTDGGKEIIHFSGDIELGGKDIDVYDPTIMATSCYLYETVGNIPICIDPDPYGITSEKKVCSIPSSYSIGGGSQGAPVVISKVEEEVMSNRVQFRIFVKNSGKGDVIDYSLLEDCNPYLDRLKYNDVNKVYLKSVTVSGQDISYNCKPKERYIRLDDSGSGRIYCDYTPSEGFDKEKPAYSTPLVIRLGYVYRTSLSQKVEIVRVR